jgi:hypothetical protein
MGGRLEFSGGLVAKQSLVIFQMDSKSYLVIVSQDNYCLFSVTNTICKKTAKEKQI